MKRISLFLAVCIILSSISGICLVSADGSSDAVTAVLHPVASVKNVTFTPGDSPYVSSDNYAIRSGDNGLFPGAYRQPVFLKYDISAYSEYEIVSAELIWKSGNNTPFNVYGVPGNDITVTGGETPDIIPVGGTVLAQTRGGGAALEGYDGIPSGWNVKWDITDYAAKNRDAGSFSVIINPNYGWTTAVFVSQPAVLYVKAAKKPEVTVTAVNSENEIKTDVFNNVPFKIKASVSGVSDIASVKAYSETTEAVLSDMGGGEFAGTLKVEGLGQHTVRVAAAAASGATGETSFTVTASELVKQNDIVTPAFSVNLEKGLTKPITDALTVSSKTLSRSIYQTYDFSGMKNSGYDIEKAWLVGSAKTAGGSFDFYKLTGDLKNAAEYETEPEYEQTPFASAKSVSLAPLTKEDYGITDPNAHLYLDDAGLAIENYNFTAEITDYLNRVLESSDSFAFRAYTSDSDASYEFERDFAICIKFAGQNSAPVVTFNSPDDETAYVKSAGGIIDVSFDVYDDGETDTALYLNNDKLELTRSGDTYSAQLDIDSLPIGTYVLRAVAADNGYDGVNGIKTTEAKRTFYVVKQDQRIIKKVIPLKDIAQINSDSKYVVTGDQKSDYTYNRAVLIKADVSKAADYDIQKVEVLTDWGTQPGNYNVMFHKIYDNDAWDSKTTTFDKTGSKYSRTTCASSNWNGATLKQQGYEIDSDNYKVAFDITETVIGELNNGNPVTGYLLNQFNNGTRGIGSNSCPPVLYVTYKANKLPKITLVSPIKSSLLPGNAVDVEFTVTDEDSPELGEVKVYFDGTEYGVTANGNTYKTVIPADKAEKGKHSLKITASDWVGGTRTLEKTLYISEYSVNSAELTDENGAAPVLKQGSTINFKANISTSKTEGFNAAVMLVLYDAYNSAREIKLEKMQLAQGENKDISVSITVPDINLTNAKVKAYVLDGFSSLNMLTEPLELN